MCVCVCVCVCVCLHIELRPPYYPCYRNSPNSSDLNFTCMTALIGYWKQHCDLIMLWRQPPSQLSPRCAPVYLLSHEETIVSLQHAINNEVSSREKPVASEISP